MSEAPTAANMMRNPVTDVAKAEKENGEVAVPDALNVNGGLPNGVGTEDPKGPLAEEDGKDTTAVNAIAENANGTDAQPVSDVTAAPKTANSESDNADGAPVVPAPSESSVAISTEVKSVNAESAAKDAEEEKPQNVEEGNVEAEANTNAKESTGTDAEPKKEDAVKVEGGSLEETKGEPTSPNSVRKQKAAFNIDAKPFSPVTLADPAIQGTLVGEANGMSIKVGQWGSQPFVALPHISPTAPTNVGQVAYTVPGTTQPQPVRKENSGAKESLSAFAKPWSPHPEVTVATVPPPESEVTIHPGSWSVTNVEGKDFQTPSPMVPKEISNNSFAHSISIHPKGLKSVELELFNYVCGRCPLRTLYGRLSSRQPDVTMRNVVMDVPPLCVAHLIEQITKAKVTALCVNELEGTHYDIWLDKPNMAPVLVEVISGCVWTCPMHHGHAVLGRGEEGKKYLRNYVERLKDSRPEGSNVYDVALVEVKEH